MNNHILNKMVFLFFGLLFLFAFSACRTTRGSIGYSWGQGTYSRHPHEIKTPKKNGPPPHAPAYGHRAKYKYWYYPANSVYFDMNRGVYFYLEGPNWRISASLPHAIKVGLEDHVMIEMDIDKPYVHYNEHRHKYPPGKFKKNHNKKNHNKGNHNKGNGKKNNKFSLKLN